MFVAYTVKMSGIIKCWQCYGVCEDYNGVVSKVLGDGWLNPWILSVQSLEAHQQIPSIGGIFVAMIFLDFHTLLVIYCQSQVCSSFKSHIVVADGCV